MVAFVLIEVKGDPSALIQMFHFLIHNTAAAVVAAAAAVPVDNMWPLTIMKNSALYLPHPLEWLVAYAGFAPHTLNTSYMATSLEWSPCLPNG